MTRLLAIYLLADISIKLAQGMTCNAGSIAVGERCVACSPGYYREANSKNVCLPCPRGTFNPAYGVEHHALCRSCFEGSFNPNLGASSCKPCSGGKWSSFGAVECRICPPGSRFVFLGRSCEPCPKNTYSMKKNSVYCTYCPYGKRSEPGSNHPSDCVPCTGSDICTPSCAISEYWNAKVNDCVVCPLGTLSGTTKATSIDECKPCEAGAYRGLGPNNHFCMGCPLGRTTKAAGGVLCISENERCPTNMFEDSKGNCMVCDQGYRLDAEKKVCRKCEAGEVSEGGVETQCKRCTGDTTPDRQSSICGCPAGTYHSNSLCVPCPKGTYNIDDGLRLDVCDKCDADMVAEKDGSVECKPCPAGMVPNKYRTKCVKCPKGLVANFLILSPWVNEPSGHWTCVNPATGCPNNFLRLGPYDDEYYYWDCEPRTCHRSASVDEVGISCFPCEKGYKLVEGEVPRCQRCSVSEVSAGGLSETCKRCPNNMLRDAKQGDKCSCVGPNAIGRGLKDGICNPCPTGWYAEENDLVCKPCPGGTFGPLEGESECYECPMYSVSTPGSIQCHQCPTGTYVNRHHRATKCVSTG